jgi:hypothetical protein
MTSENAKSPRIFHQECKINLAVRTPRDQVAVCGVVRVVDDWDLIVEIIRLRNVTIQFPLGDTGI